MGKIAKQKKRRLQQLLITPNPDMKNRNAISSISPDDVLTTFETLTQIANNPNLLRCPELKTLRTALYNISAQKGELSLVAKITEALELQRWPDSLRLLQSLRESGIKPKLGAIQRWVRFCDASSFLHVSSSKLLEFSHGKYNPEVLRILDLILRIAEPSCSSDPLAILEPWEPISKTAQTSFKIFENYKGKFNVVLHQKGEDRRTKNLHDFILYHSHPGTIKFSAPSNLLERKEVPNVPGAFVVTNVLGSFECNQILSASESIGYTADKPLAGEASLQRSVLAHNFFWLADDSFLDVIFDRVKTFIPPVIEGLRLTGINPRCRLYRYVPGAIYRPHIDGAWPRSGMKDGEYCYDMYGNERSRLTMLLYLNDNFEGGHTTFFVPSATVGVLNTQAIIPRMGCIAFFPHGDTNASLLHEGSAVEKGTKYILRTDVLYTLPETEWKQDDIEPT